MLTVIAVGVFPLVLAGYSGYLATIALPAGFKKKTALWFIWSLAVCGVVVFAVTQAVAYKADGDRVANDEQFKEYVRKGLQGILYEPDPAKRIVRIADLRAVVGVDRKSLPVVLPPDPAPQRSLPTPMSPPVQPDYRSLSTEDRWPISRRQWTDLGNELSVYKRANNFKIPLSISYLQGDRDSWLFAQELRVAFGNGGWAAKLVPRTDISYIQGVVSVQSSVELRPDGVNSLQATMKAAGINFFIDESEQVPAGKFELLVGKIPEKSKGAQ